MKKILITLLAFTFPIAAYAQNPFNQPRTKAAQKYTQEQIWELSTKDAEATLHQFFPIFCNSNMQQAIDAVKECYQKKSINNLNIQQCMIADFLIGYITKDQRQLAKETGQTLKYDVDYINDYWGRINSHILQTLLTTNLTAQRYQEYIAFAAVQTDRELQHSNIYKQELNYPEKEKAKSCTHSDFYKNSTSEDPPAISEDHTVYLH